MRITPDKQIFDDKNKYVGYVENDQLFAIDRDGYAVPVGNVDSNAQTLERLREWQSLN